MLIQLPNGDYINPLHVLSVTLSKRFSSRLTDLVPIDLRQGITLMTETYIRVCIVPGNKNIEFPGDEYAKNTLAERINAACHWDRQK